MKITVEINDKKWRPHRSSKIIRLLGTITLLTAGCTKLPEQLVGPVRGILHPVKDHGLISQVAQNLTRYGYPISTLTSGEESLQPVSQGASEIEVMSEGTYKFYFGPKPSQTLQPVKLIVVSSTEASQIGAVDTCLAVSRSRLIICSENFELSIRSQVEDLLGKYLAGHSAVERDPVLTSIKKVGLKPLIYAHTLGLVEVAILHELGHIYHHDPLIDRNGETSSVAGLCGGPDPASVSNELVTDSIAVDILDSIKEVNLHDDQFPGKSFALIGDEAMRFVLLTFPTSAGSKPDGCDLYRKVCLSSPSHPPYFQRIVINASIILANEKGYEKEAGQMGKFF